MKKTISAIVVSMAISLSGTASAATVNIGTEPGLYDISWAVTKTNNNASINLDGTIAPHTNVTFTYSLDSGNTDTYGAAMLQGQGTYNYYQNKAGNVVYTPTNGYNTYYYGVANRIVVEDNDADGQDAGVYGNPSDNTNYLPLVLLTSAADITPGGRVGTFVLTNNSNGLVNYFTQFSATVSALRNASYTYRVTSLASPVPLPGALPLFAGAMLMVGAIRSKQKRS